MSSAEAKENTERAKTALVIEDLENFLQRCFSNENLKMISYRATNLLPLGENYMSILVKLDAKVCQSKDDQEKDLNFVVKMADPRSTMALWPIGFKKELFMYAELLPMYRDIEREADVEEDDLINIIPKFIGYRNSLKYGNEIDSNSCFIMENLKVENYYTLDRRTGEGHKGLDILHAKKCFAALARFHAMGIAIKQKRPQFDGKVLEHAQLTFFKDELLENCINCARRIFKECSRLSKYLDKLESSIKCTMQVEHEEPWVTINHSDFWTNNIMFHKDENGNIDDVKLIDFQSYRCGSPLKDIGNFVVFSLDEVALYNHVNELFQLYYDNFIGTLKRVRCDVKPFTKESFEKELKKQLLAGFVWGVVSIKVYLHEIREDVEDRSELQKKALDSEISQVCKERIYKLVEFYESHDWFS